MNNTIENHAKTLFVEQQALFEKWAEIAGINRIPKELFKDEIKGFCLAAWISCFVANAERKGESC